MATKIITTKILDGPMTLGCRDIDAFSIKVNGGSPPDNMLFDCTNGFVMWADQNKLGDPGPYNIEFEYTPPAVAKPDPTTAEKFDALVEKLVEKEIITSTDAQAVKELTEVKEVK